MFEQSPSGQNVLRMRESWIDEAESAQAGSIVQLSGAARRDWTKLIQQSGVGS